jgi:hypothetical protein
MKLQRKWQMKRRRLRAGEREKRNKKKFRRAI